jgi:hypothetical protein
MIPDRYADRSPDLFRRLKPLYGHRIDVLWLEYQTADVERKHEIDVLLTLLAVKRLGMAVGDERIVLEPPPAELIGRGEYTLGSVSYPGLPGYAFRVGRNDLLRHLFILGPTGTGKSTLILGLLQQLLCDGAPVMVFDFKRGYRCLLDAPGAADLVVLTVGRATAPLFLNALQPPRGVGFAEWAAGLADIISASYLLMQGARNVLMEALLQAHREKGQDATFKDAHQLLDLELRATRSGSRRYGWLESSARSLEELSKGGYGEALSAINGIAFADLMRRPVVFELQGLGDDQKKFFCLYCLHAVLQLRKNDTATREVLQHILVFDEAHNVFPKEQYGELGVPSRLAREVREYGEAIIAATQQADVADSLIANSGIKIILRTDYPKDVDFASKLLQIEPRWIPKLALGTGIARLPTRFYTPFLFTFPPQPRKNHLVTDEEVTRRFDEIGGIREKAPPHNVPGEVTEKERALLMDIAAVPIAGITARYDRLGWHPMTGNPIKNSIITKGLATFENVATGTARIRILTLTTAGMEYLEKHGVTLPTGRRGGAAHEYWRATIRSILERAGYTTTEEFPVGEGRTVDLHATKGQHEVVVEVETGKSDISANIQKCKNLPGTVVFFFLTTALRDAWQNAAPTSALALTPGDLDQLAAVLP